MGLDLVVYKNIEIVSKYDDYNFIAYTLEKEWDWKIKNLKKDCYYKGDCVANGRIGYTTHKHFRIYLLNILGINVDDLYIDGLHPSIPFSELIDFADNEGCLDFEVCEKLYNDFENNKHLISSEWIDKYNMWLNLFKEAKDNGVLVFG